MNATYNFKNIMVFNPSYLGDTVLTTPLINALHILYPDAKITFVVRPEATPLYEGLEPIDVVIPFDKRGEYKGFRGFREFAKLLKTKEFDLVVNLHKSIRSTAIMFLLKTYVVGFKSAVFSFIFDKRIMRDKYIHEVHRNLSILSTLTENYSLEEAIKLGGSTFTYKNKRLVRNCKMYHQVTTDDKKTVGLFISSAWDTKRYPAQSFAKVAEILYKNDISIALFGTESDSVAINEFLQHYRFPYFDYVSKVPLRELPSFLASVDMLISNDSGPLHIAVSVGTKVVAIFGPTVRYQGFFPYDDNSTIIENTNLDCRPCSKHGSKRCPKKHFRCMIDIKPEDVAKTVINLL